MNVFATPNEKKEEHYWKLKRAGAGYVYVENLKNGHVLDIMGSGTGNGTNLIVYNRTGTTNQKFKIQKLKKEIHISTIVSEPRPQ
ncbi:RICIN domain-containing protein [Bacillus thuringiensis]|uniref:RICIN domain-containing protein n=1 Tax=Bacillus thuringiensis TaxID=1428 RepID=UPI001EE970A6|nr:RICIN domain-containing protein [Bacillus thuringiensis]